MVLLSIAVKKSEPFLANGAAKQIHLERLPAYAPDLNPDEGTWQHFETG